MLNLYNGHYPNPAQKHLEYLVCRAKNPEHYYVKVPYFDKIGFFGKRVSRADRCTNAWDALIGIINPTDRKETEINDLDVRR